MQKISPIILGLMVGLIFVFSAYSATPNKIAIKAIHVNQTVGTELNSGPIFWPGINGRPGQGRTIAIAAHRTTYTRPFYSLDKLKKGQIIKLTYRSKVYKYRIVKTLVQPSSNLHIADDLGHERLILSACARADGSPTSLSYRIVVYARPL